MIGFWLVNLLIPGDPENVKITTSSGEWNILKYAAKFQESKNAIDVGQCAQTYSIENGASLEDSSEICEKCFEEMTPILLGMSYLSGLSVTAKYPLPYSDCSGIIRPSDSWPRERAICGSNFCVTNEIEYAEVLEKFVVAWCSNGRTEQALILIHHWLDALACWSFENLYLCATTLLQIIAKTEKQIIGNRSLSLFCAINSASRRAGIDPLSEDFKKMRNDLIHEGKLIGSSFSGKSFEDCCHVVADLLIWFDEYIHSTLNLGPVKRKRYMWHNFENLNSFSIENF